MPTVNQFIADRTAEMSGTLVRAIRKMPTDKTEWKPLDNGRTVLDQVQECVGANKFALTVLQTYTLPERDPDHTERLQKELDTLDKAVAALEGSTAQIVAAIKEFPTEKLDEKIVLPFRGGFETSYAWVANFCYMHLTYHYGQINYVQTLYGDFE